MLSPWRCVCFMGGFRPQDITKSKISNKIFVNHKKQNDYNLKEMF